jgi:hypothetical protein
MYPLTATFVEVPMSVQVPPRMEAKASGISNRDGLVFAFLAIPITGGTSIAATVVLFINADTLPALPMRISSRVFGPHSPSLTNRSPTAFSKPVSCKAPLITKIEPRMMMMSLLKPSNASAGVSTPLPTSTTSSSRVMTSTGSLSVANSATARTSRLRTMAICIAPQ